MTSIELIAKERKEQIEKHGYTAEFTENNPQYYSENQLANVARGLLFSETEFSPMDAVISLGGANNWNKDYLKYAESKPYKDRLVIAAALISAELDRISPKEVSKTEDRLYSKSDMWAAFVQGGTRKRITDDGFWFKDWIEKYKSV